jgi:CRISPR/Cas system CSM-associated protein Csm2 small subunit
MEVLDNIYSYLRKSKFDRKCWEINMKMRRMQVLLARRKIRRARRAAIAEGLQKIEGILKMLLMCSKTNSHTKQG